MDTLNFIINLFVIMNILQWFQTQQGVISAVLGSLTLLNAIFIYRSNKRDSQNEKMQKDIDFLKEKKADKTYVDTEMDKISKKVSSEIDRHISESNTFQNLLLEHAKTQSDRIESIDRRIENIDSKLDKKIDSINQKIDKTIGELIIAIKKSK